MPAGSAIDAPGRGHDCEYQRLVGRAADSCRPAWQDDEQAQVSGLRVADVGQPQPQ